MKLFEKFWLIVFTLFIITLVSYPILTPKDILIKEDTEYLYYKEYSWWGLDSCYYKYHKPIYDNGIVTNVTRSQHIVGVLGKGGHWNSDFVVTICSESKTYTYKDEIFGLIYTHPIYNKGDKVNIKETFYPRYNIEYWK